MLLQYLEALKAIGMSPSTTYVIPAEFTQLVEPLTRARDRLAAGGTSTPPAPPAPRAPDRRASAAGPPVGRRARTCRRGSQGPVGYYPSASGGAARDPRLSE